MYRSCGPSLLMKICKEVESGGQEFNMKASGGCETDWGSKRAAEIQNRLPRLGTDGWNVCALVLICLKLRH